ncbi:MAG: YdcF family protein [Candidatus Nanopelagicaceae bacterium]
MTGDDLFFYAAKIAGWFLKVDNLLVLGVIVTIGLFWQRRYKVARRATIALAISLIFFSNLGISYAALRALEDRFPIPEVKCSNDFQGVIVLGGGMSSGLIPEQRRQPQLGEAGERLTKALELLNRCPDFKLIYSTFSGALRPEGMSEAEAAEQFFSEQGISMSRTIFENQSRNTFENAKFSSEIVKSRAGWILVTSASHLPRAVTTFERFGWEVTPYPVDYRSETSGRYLDFSRGLSAQNWNNAIHEWVGNAAYSFRSAD